jgi:hypothetical protein
MRELDYCECEFESSALSPISSPLPVLKFKLVRLELRQSFLQNRSLLLQRFFSIGAYDSARRSTESLRKYSKVI